MDRTFAAAVLRGCMGSIIFKRRWSAKGEKITQGIGVLRPVCIVSSRGGGSFIRGGFALSHPYSFCIPFLSEKVSLLYTFY